MLINKTVLRFFVPILCLSILLVGCNGATTSSGSGATAPDNADNALLNLSEPIAQAPALVTSAGQSADFEMLKVVLEQNEIPFEANPLAGKADFGDAKTLVVAIGGSSKGLGAAGIDADAELKRVQQLLGDAKAAGMTIIAAHVGGESRRGKLGDRFIEPCVVASDYTVVVESGNKDGIFTQIAKDNNIPIAIVPSILEVVEAVGDAFIP